MAKIEVEVGPEAFRFTSLDNWRDKAPGWFAAAGLDSRDALCVDARGRVCTHGRDFTRADRDGAYPVVVYRRP